MFVDRDALAEMLGLADRDIEHAVDEQVIDLGDPPLPFETQVVDDSPVVFLGEKKKSMA